MHEISQASHHSKVCGPSVVYATLLQPKFQCCTIRLLVKNGKQTDTSYNKIGLCAQNMSTILGSVVDTIGRAYVIT